MKDLHHTASLCLQDVPYDLGLFKFWLSRLKIDRNLREFQSFLSASIRIPKAWQTQYFQTQIMVIPHTKRVNVDFRLHFEPTESFGLILC